MDLTADGLLQGRALDAWQQEDLTPAWLSSATAFIRGGKRDGKKNNLVIGGCLLLAKNWGKASLIRELHLVKQCGEVCIFLAGVGGGVRSDNLGMICFLRLGVEEKQRCCSPTPLEVKCKEGETKKSLCS